MAKKMLGKVVAGAALGGASLLVFAPGVAFADGHPHDDEGKVFAKPHAAKPGEEIKLVQICEEPQEHPFVWSKVTGKVKLEPAHKDRDWDGDRGGWDDKDRDHKDRDKDWGKDKDWDSGKDWKDEKDRDHDQDRKDWTGGEERGDRAGGEERKDWTGGEEWSGESATQPAPEAGAGGGAADGEDRDWKGHEGDERDGKKGREHDERDEKGHKDDERGWKGDWKDEKSDEHGKDDGWEHKKDFVFFGEARIARDAKPGTYKLEGSCGTGELVVLPHGGVDGGDGGIATGANGGMATAGASLVGAAALGGLVLMRRRRTDEFTA
ncbi:hypothetical protein ACQPYA_25740 [Micromonospora sp. CA-263727]|uniref:hypothetical protein n=1 Tax=Micromonospora sp. CA-263727 TaxID=3239967 RepID=UPI003D9151B7